MTDSVRPPSVSIAAASAAGLAYEILLLRLFSITQFHHTAYMVISLALLGFGASGALLTATGSRWLGRFRSIYPLLLVAGGLAMLICFAVAQLILVSPEEMLWEPRQAARLALVYLLLALPFLFIGSAIGLALMRFRPGWVYAADLSGAAAGSVFAIVLLFLVLPETALRWLSTLCCLAAAIGALEMGVGKRSAAGRLAGERPRGERPRGERPTRRSAATTTTTAAAGGLVVGLIWMVPGAWIEPHLSPYKSLSQALRVQGAHLAAQRSSPLAWLAVVENSDVPLRHAPGLSFAAPRGPAEQLGLFIDGGALTPIVRRGDRRDLAYLDYFTSAVPYHLEPPASVLVLGAGGGEGVLRASLAGAETIVAVEIDPQVVALVSDDYGEYAGGIFERPGVEIVTADMRGFARRDARTFDLVEHSALGGFGGGAPALASLSESYLYTVEAIGLYLDRLAPNGFLALTTWVKNPPRDTLKMTATVLEALERRGIDRPTESLAVIRGWRTSTLLVKNGVFSPSEIERLRVFCEERFFDVVFYPGMDESEANRFNRLEGPVMHRAVVALSGSQRRAFLERYAFDIRPATDDRPFFHQFFRWRSLPGILAAKGRGGLPLLEAGYLILVVTLLQAVLAGLVLIILPWARLRRGGSKARGRGVSKAALIGYFAALGLGFLFLEVAYLQKFILFLHHPVYSAAVVLASFLLFAGLGSAASTRLSERPGSGAGRAAAVVVGLGVIELLAVPLLAPFLGGVATWLRVSAAVLLIAPLAFFMGMPFPLALSRLRHRAPELVPWAWGINGCASVVSPILATLIAVHFGFSLVVALALLAYAGAGTLAARLFSS